MDVSSKQKDSICDFSVQTGQEEVSQNCNENTVDSLDTSAVPTTFAFVPDDLEKKKERLKEELFNLKPKHQEMEQENEIFVTMYYLLIKYAVTAQAFF